MCVIDAANSVLRCSSPDGVAFDLALPEADNYVAMSPDDFKKVLDRLSRRCRP